MRAWCLCEVLEKLYKIGCDYEKDVQDYEEISLCEATRGVSYRYVLAVKIPLIGIKNIEKCPLLLANLSNSE